MAVITPAASSAVIHRTLPIVLTLVVLLGILTNFLSITSDPHRCRGILTNGTWLNPVQDDGSRLPLDNWQPDGCIMHKYTAQDLHDCVEQRHLVFIGDSTTRGVYWGVARILDKKLANKQRKTLGRHESYDLEFDGIRMVFLWNPFMGVDEANNTATANELRLYSEQRLHPKPVAEQQNAALIFIGAGPWFVGKGSHTDFPPAFDNLTSLLPHAGFPSLENLPLSGDDGLGPQIFFAPPVAPNYAKENPRLKNPNSKGMKGRVDYIQDYLDEHAEENDILLIRSIPELFRNQFAVTVDPRQTGFHVIDSVAEIKANLFLNARCNAKLDRLHGYPYDRTCCTDYGTLAFPQLFIILLSMAYLSLCVLNELRAILSHTTPKSTLFNLDIGMFVTALLACYWADRTQAFAKGSKQYVPHEFAVLCLFTFIIALSSITKSKARPRPGQSESPSDILIDTKPLSRDQTDEWKGWMQAVILIYHWTGASRILSIYIFIRLLVAAYLFQSGFGHAVYFLTKKDFSFRRVASVLLRLNLLSCALPYIMHTEYMFYYFAPLISFWFLVIYAVFAIAPQHNDTNGLYAKLVIAAVVCPGLMIWTPIMSWVFSILSLVFRINWDLHEWQFRLGLDGFIVYIGIITGVASVQSKLYHKILTQTKGVAGIVGFFAIQAYLLLSIYCLPNEKTAYNALHPFISFIPILGFIALRNVNATARIWYFRDMSRLGRCSLETFTLQFHIFLAADTKGVLLLESFGGGDGSLLDRWRSLWFIVPVFLYISSRAADATNGWVKLITGPESASSDVELQEISMDLERNEDDVPLLGKQGGMSWLRSWTCSSFARLPNSIDLRVKVGIMLVLMWVMNLLY